MMSNKATTDPSTTSMPARKRLRTRLSVPNNALQCAPHLLGLPRELRDEIYLHLWHMRQDESPFAACFADCMIWAYPKGTEFDDLAARKLRPLLIKALANGTNATGLPKWLLANTTLLDEGLQCLSGSFVIRASKPLAGQGSTGKPNTLIMQSIRHVAVSAHYGRYFNKSSVMLQVPAPAFIARLRNTFQPGMIHLNMKWQVDVTNPLSPVSYNVLDAATVGLMAFSDEPVCLDPLMTGASELGFAKVSIAVHCCCDERTSLQQIMGTDGTKERAERQRTKKLVYEAAERCMKIMVMNEEFGIQKIVSDEIGGTEGKKTSTRKVFEVERTR